MAKSPDQFDILKSVHSPKKSEKIDIDNQLLFGFPTSKNSFCCDPSISKPQPDDLQANYDYHAQSFLFHQQALVEHFGHDCKDYHYQEALTHGRKAEENYLQNEGEINENKLFHTGFHKFLSRHLVLEGVNKRKKNLQGHDEIARFDIDSDEDRKKPGQLSQLKQYFQF